MRTQNRRYKGALQLNVLKQTLQSGKRVDAADLIEYAARLDGEYRNSRTAPLADIYREYPPRLTLQSYADFLGGLTQLSHEERKVVCGTKNGPGSRKEKYCAGLLGYKPAAGGLLRPLEEEGSRMSRPSARLF